MSTSEIKQKADNLIEKYALTIPVHVFQLADYMGISWKNCTPYYIKSELKNILPKNQQERSDEILGVFDGKRNIIFLNEENHPITRKRFTMAHEIGHTILHNNLHKHRVRVFFRGDIFSSENEEEREANYFAAYLLMPDISIKNRLNLTQAFAGSDELIRSFSKMFAVSPEAMRIRFQTFKNEYPDEWRKYNLGEKVF